MSGGSSGLGCSHADPLDHRHETDWEVDMALVDSTPVYWSFVQSASSQAQLTATLAGITITAMVLVLSP